MTYDFKVNVASGPKFSASASVSVLHH